VEEICALFTGIVVACNYDKGQVNVGRAGWLLTFPLQIVLSQYVLYALMIQHFQYVGGGLSIIILQNNI
jgi:hypothetical protein